MKHYSLFLTIGFLYLFLGRNAAPENTNSDYPAGNLAFLPTDLFRPAYHDNKDVRPPSPTINLLAETTVSSNVSNSTDDAEERFSGTIFLNDADIDLVYSGNFVQTVGMRFSNLNIPPAAIITNAYIQFTTHNVVNTDPCNLTIYGHAIDDAPTFSSVSGDITGRSRTTASVPWSPPQWLVADQSGPNQQTPDIAAVIQEIVDRSGYTANSSIAIIMDGVGSRSSKSFDTSPTLSPELWITYTLDCPQMGVMIGDPCDDGDPSTIGDVIGPGCLCAGTSIYDCPDLQVNIGDPCDDGDPNNFNDIIQADCSCAGTTFCENLQLSIGAPCDDGDPFTGGETVQTDCTCSGGTKGRVTTCKSISISSDDAEEHLIDGFVSLNNADLELINDPTFGNQQIGLRFQNLGIPAGVVILSAYIQFTVDETTEINPCNLTFRGQASANPGTFTSQTSDVSNRPVTTASTLWQPPSWDLVGIAGPGQQTADLSAIIQEIVNLPGYSYASPISIIASGTGKRTAVSWDGNPASAPKLCVTYEVPCTASDAGMPCDDGDPCTINDRIFSDCACIGIIQDTDNDGVPDGCDQCPGFDDNIDVDNDGVPDACDDCVGQHGAACPSGDCTINGDPIPSGTYAATNRITSTGKIPLGASVVFQAGNSHELKPGFTVSAGGKFHAVIVECQQPAALSTIPSEVLAITTRPTLRALYDPVASETLINYKVEQAGMISIRLVDGSGSTVMIPLSSTYKEAGNYELRFKTGIPAGIYYAQLQYEEGIIQDKLILTEQLKTAGQVVPGKEFLVQVRPNPFQDQFRLFIESSAPETERATIRIIDTNGRTIYQRSDAPVNGEITIGPKSKWANGLYFIQIIAGQFTSTQTIVKQ